MRSLLGGKLSAALAGCAVHAVDPHPQPLVAAGEPDAYVHDPRAAVAPAPEAEGAAIRATPTGAWWRDFGDSGLDVQIDAALRGNPDVRAIGQRIAQANAQLVQAGARLFPVIDAAGDIGRRWDEDGEREDRLSLGFLFGWELDAWGRLSSARNARSKEVEVAWEDWLAGRLLLSSAVAETWFELAEQRGQLRLLHEQIEVNETLLRLTRLRFGQGQSSVVDVLQQQQQLEATQALAPAVEARVADLELALDTLAGDLPDGRDRSPDATLRPPPVLASIGVPSELLAQRPDLRARRARVIALDYEVGEAIADRLPRFAVGGDAAGTGSLGLERIAGEAVAAAVGPVFDAGARRAEVKRRRARVAEALDAFTAAFLAAVRDVETALVQERQQVERIRRQESRLETTQRLLRESRNRYSQGLTDYLPVLSAVTTVQDLERDLLTLRREWLSFRIALHRALGGPMPDPNS